MFIIAQFMKRSCKAEDSFPSCNLGFNDDAAGNSLLWDWFSPTCGLARNPAPGLFDYAIRDFTTVPRARSPLLYIKTSRGSGLSSFSAVSVPGKAVCICTPPALQKRYKIEAGYFYFK